MKKDLTLIEEGRKYHFGYIVPGALKLPEGEIEVMLAGLHDKRDGHLGWARNFRREDNKIVAEVEIKDTHEDIADMVFNHGETLMSAGPFVKGLDWDHVTRTCKDGEIIYVDVFAIPGIPKIETKEKSWEIQESPSRRPTIGRWLSSFWARVRSK